MSPQWMWKILNKGMCILLFTMLSGVVFPALAELPRRSLEIELDEVPGSTGYEVQVTRILPDGTKKKPIVFKLKNNLWSAKLVPGKFELRMRSFDRRKVPGDWGNPEQFEVKPPPLKLESPASDEKIQAADPKEHEVTLKWEALESTKVYKVKILKQDGSLFTESQIETNRLNIKLPVAEKFTWQVTAIIPGEISSEETELKTFTILGPELNPPKITSTPDINACKIEWSNPEFSKSIDYILEKKTEQGWKQLDKASTSSNFRFYKKCLTSGKYRIKMVAHGDLRKDSSPLEKNFETQLINRSPAAIEQIRAESAFQNNGQFFANATWYFSLINYRGPQPANNSGTQFIFGGSESTAMGGSGVLGLGYWFKEAGQNGAYLHAELSGFDTESNCDGDATCSSNNSGRSFMDKKVFYYNVGPYFIHRTRLYGLGQLRFKAGVAYRSYPRLYFSNSGQITKSSVTTYAPGTGVTLYHGFTRKFGVQISTFGSYNVAGSEKLSGSNNFNLEGSFMGSLRIKDNLLGFAGAAYRVDMVDNTGSSIFTNDGITRIEGLFLNLSLEYGF